MVSYKGENVKVGYSANFCLRNIINYSPICEASLFNRTSHRGNYILLLFQYSICFVLFITIILICYLFLLLFHFIFLLL